MYNFSNANILFFCEKTSFFAFFLIFSLKIFVFQNILVPLHHLLDIKRTISNEAIANNLGEANVDTTPHMETHPNNAKDKKNMNHKT